jgi:hypothetical protein
MMTNNYKEIETLFLRFWKPDQHLLKEGIPNYDF